MGDIVYQNKDVVSKVMAERFAGKSLRIDNLFLLEDGSIAILDYESHYRKQDRIK